MIHVRDNQPRTKLAVIALWAVAGFAFLQLIVMFYYYFEERYVFRRLAQYQFEDGWLISANLISIALSIFAIIAFSMWLFHASKNVRESGLRNVKFEPGWAVGWFFIPIANFFMTQQVMQEVYQGSAAISGKCDQWRWRAAPSGPVSGWFVFWLLNFVTSFIFSIVQESRDRETILVFAVVSFAVEAVAAFMALRMVKAIDQLQSQPKDHWEDWGYPPPGVLGFGGPTGMPPAGEQPMYQQPQYNMPPGGYAPPLPPQDWPGKRQGYPPPPGWGAPQGPPPPGYGYQPPMPPQPWGAPVQHPPQQTWGPPGQAPNQQSPPPGQIPPQQQPPSEPDDSRWEPK